MFGPFAKIEASFMINKQAKTLAERSLGNQSRATPDFDFRSISFQFYAEVKVTRSSKTSVMQHFRAASRALTGN
ncbi:hypothetical protein [Bradyrhizobium sp. Ash2021]|uniref:hypothetical protein n=1 Tax=Bradyrhizobium sp. Ash2021 TaxID=2954771 RepID=UPI002815A951|nr:hypothetical protein [Bradyrhizobium sp. Ash2021]WMT78004.1 hypothetical protein NL528_17365 [Bradyrhizobium sp. Ash2021]